LSFSTVPHVPGHGPLGGQSEKQLLYRSTMEVKVKHYCSLLGRQQGRTIVSGRLLLWACCILALICPVLLQAQEFRGTIMGQVTDSTGAVIPNASVVAVGPQQTYKATTSAKGDFTIPFIQPGTYNISVEAAGFKKISRQGVVVNVSDKLNLTFALEVGAVSETVTVSADQVQVNTADASGGTIIDPQQVASLPMNGRQIYSLLALTPGAKTGTLGTSTKGTFSETNNTSFNGQSGNYTQFAMNGAPVSQQNGGGSGTWNFAPSVDAVEEFKVMTNTYDAQYGRTNGGTVNTILKSGTDHYHGTLSEFWRNSVLDANSYTANQQGIAKQFHNQHQFGGTFGGPVPKLGNNTFFFFSYEGYREIVPQAIVTTTITPDMLPDANGNVNLGPYLAATGRGNIYDPLTTTCIVPGQNGGCSSYGRQQFANNTIPASRISPIGLNILKLLPMANRPGYVDNYVTSNPGRTSYNQPIVRIDHNFSDATRVYGMFGWWSGSQYINQNGFPGAAAMGSINNYESTLTQVVDVTHTFKPNLFADLRLSYNRMYNMSPDGAVSGGLYNLTATSLGLNMPSIPTTSHDWAPEFHSDDNAIGNSNNGYGNNWVGNTVGPTIFETYDIAPSLTHVVGKHNLHYGAQIDWYHDIPNGIRRPNGGFNFGPGWTQEDPYHGANDGSTIASMLLGYPSWGGVEYNLATYESYKDYAAYIQDDWKVRHNVTLNLGLRYENETSPMDRWGRLQAGLCLTCAQPLNNYVDWSSINTTLPNGQQMTSPLVGGLMFQKDRTPYQNTWGILLPKVGVSVGLTNNLVMRGGWGLYRALGFELGGTSTFDANTSYQTSLDGGLTPNMDFNSGTPFPNGAIVPAGDSQGLMSGVGDGIWYDTWYRKIPYTHQFSFGFQGEAPGQIIWDVEYVGARTFDLRAGMQQDHLTAAQFAQGTADPNYLNQSVTNPFYHNPVLSPGSYLYQQPTLHNYELMVPYPQYDSGCCGPEVWEWNTPQGYSHYDSLVAKAEKRLSGGGLLSRGLSFTAAFTWSKLMSATGRLNNGLLTDPQPTYGIDGSDRPITFSIAGVYELPIGKGGFFAPDAKGVLGHVINNWQINWIISDQSGTPVGYPNGYAYTCGTFNPKPSSSSYSSYLNNSDPSCFAPLPQYTPITQYGMTTAVRTPWAEQTQLGLEKQFAIREGLKLQFRAEAFNLTNTPIFYGPNTGSPDRAITRNNNILAGQPGAYSGYGTIGSGQLNSPREFQLGLKVLF
jgi:hypothetical protein